MSTNESDRAARRAPSSGPSRAAKQAAGRSPIRTSGGSRARAVVDVIASGIRQGTFAPGQRLPSQLEMAHSFGVSRTVIREAVKLLEGQGLVHTRERSGLYVATSLPHANPGTPHTDETITLAEVLDVARALWYLAIELVARTASDDAVAALRSVTADFLPTLGSASVSERFIYETSFGLRLSETSGNAFCHKVMLEMFALTGDIDMVVISHPRYAEIVRNDARIVEAVAERDAARARFYAQERDRLITAIVSERPDLLARRVQATLEIR